MHICKQHGKHTLGTHRLWGQTEPQQSRDPVTGTPALCTALLTRFFYEDLEGGADPHVGAVYKGLSDRCFAISPPVIGQPSEAFSRPCNGCFTPSERESFYMICLRSSVDLSRYP